MAGVKLTERLSKALEHSPQQVRHCRRYHDDRGIVAGAPKKMLKLAVTLEKGEARARLHRSVD